MDRNEIREIYRGSGGRAPAAKRKKGSFFAVFGSQFVLCASVVLLAFMVKSFSPEAVSAISTTVDSVMGENTGFEKLGQELQDALMSLPVFGRAEAKNEPQSAPDSEVAVFSDAEIIPEDASGISFITNKEDGKKEKQSVSFTNTNYFLKYGDQFFNASYGEDAITADELFAAKLAGEKAERDAQQLKKEEEQNAMAAAKAAIIAKAKSGQKLTSAELLQLDYPSGALRDKLYLGMELSAPLHGTVTDDFGWRNHPTVSDVRFHFGQDIAAARGTEIKCAFSGSVEEVGSSRSYGNYITVRYNSKLTVFYGHCDKIFVKEGDRVKKGQAVAAVGSTGISTGNHLHVELKWQGDSINPNFYFKV